jgi:hypothetical protein
VRKHAGVRLDRAHKHELARAGLAGGRVERVSDQIADFQVQVVAENFRHCVPRGGFWSSLGALQHRQKQQGRTTTATCYVASVSQAREVEAVEGFYVEV